jgi:glycosyltransferase involved in cell wall biosynthesis
VADQFENTVGVVTISKGDLEGLAVTIASIKRQKNISWKCLIVLPDPCDISSTFVKHISDEDPRFDFTFQANPGLYEAMNSGLQNIGTRFIWFMNGGDKFASDEAIASAASYLKQENAKLVIGGYQYWTENRLKIYVKKARLQSAETFALNIRGGCHQSMLFDMSDFYEPTFNTDYRLASDFDFVLRFSKTNKVVQINDVLAEVNPNGVSNVRIFEVLAEKQAIRRNLFPDSRLLILQGQIQNFMIKMKIKIRQIL